MLNKVKYLLLVIGLLFLIPACTTEKSFDNTEAVIKALDKHDISKGQETFFTMIGANDGTEATLTVTTKNETGKIAREYADLEIYTFDGNARNACQLHPYCSLVETDSDFSGVAYYGNVMIVIDQSHIDSVMEDLKD